MNPTFVVSVAPNVLALAVAALALVLVLWTIRGKARCEREIDTLKAQIVGLTRQLQRFSSCPCPRLRQVEELALAEMANARSKTKRNLELEQALGRVLDEAMAPAKTTKED